MLDRLEHARKKIAAREADEVALRDVDESLEELGSLCLAKTLKSRFRDAARRVVRQPDDKRDLRKSFQRAILKAKVAHRMGRSDGSSHRDVDRARHADHHGDGHEDHSMDFRDGSHHNSTQCRSQAMPVPSRVGTGSRSEAAWQPELNRSSTQGRSAEYLELSLVGTQSRPHAGDALQRLSSDVVPTSTSLRRPTIQQTHSLEEHHTDLGVRKLMDRAALAAKKNSVRAMILAAQLEISHNQWHVPETEQQASEIRHPDSRHPPGTNECSPEDDKSHSDRGPKSSTLQLSLCTPQSTCDQIRPPEGQSPRCKPVGRPKASPLAAALRGSVGLSQARSQVDREVPNARTSKKPKLPGRGCAQARLSGKIYFSCGVLPSVCVIGISLPRQVCRVEGSRRTLEYL